MPCATITINDTGETPGEEEPPKEEEEIDLYLILAGVALIIILIFKR